MDLKILLENISKNEIKNLYSDLDRKYVQSEIDTINNIVFKNEDIFLNILLEVESKISNFRSFKKSDFFSEIVLSYNRICEHELAFSVLFSKFIIIFYNELNGANTLNNVIKNRYDLVNFLRDKMYFMYLYMLNSAKIYPSVLTEKNIIKIIEINSLKIVENLCEKKIIRSKNINAGGKTTIFVEIPNFINYFKLDIYNNNFTLLKNLNNMGLKSYYIINSTVFSMYEINAISGKTGNQFIIGDKDFITEINNTKLEIDVEWLKNIFKNYCINNSLNEDNLEQSHSILKSALKDFTYENDKSNMTSVSQKMAIYHKAITLKKIIEKIKSTGENFFYLPFIIDFRGRLYKLSSISPTFLKEIRQCISFNTSEKRKRVEKDILIIEKKINECIFEEGDKLSKIENFSNLKNLNKTGKITVIWVLISIANIFRKEIGNKISLSQFTDYAVEKINEMENIKNSNLDNLIKNDFNYHLSILDDINKKGYSKKLISKDATASVYQHLVKILGGLDENSYKYTNLMDHNSWYDTYSMIIETWKHKESDFYTSNKKHIDLFFNRKTLKKTMMTENYGCGRKKCWEYFAKEIDSSKNDLNDIKKIFNNFYKFITKNCIFENSSEKIIEEMKKRKGFLKNMIDNSSTDLMYRKKIKKRINTTNEGRRTTMQKWEIDDENDINNFLEKEFNISIRANLIHFMDSSIAREIIRRIRCIAIHDCFMVEPSKISRLIAITNYVMNLKYTELEMTKKKEKIFSIFILL